MRKLNSSGLRSILSRIYNHGREWSVSRQGLIEYSKSMELKEGFTTIHFIAHFWKTQKAHGHVQIGLSVSALQIFY